jgi:hypothetical protein
MCTASVCGDETGGQLVDIPPTRIWHYATIGPNKLRDLEPEYFTKDPNRRYSAEELKQLAARGQRSLNAQIERAMHALPADENRRTRPGFAVKGTGREALQGIYDVIVKGKAPESSFPSGDSVSVVFLSYPAQPYVAVDRVIRRGFNVNIHFILVSHSELDMSWNLALISLDRLAPGRYHVKNIRSRKERQFNERGMPPVSPNAEEKIVCKSFEFEVVKQPD